MSVRLRSRVCILAVLLSASVGLGSGATSVAAAPEEPESPAVQILDQLGTPLERFQPREPRSEDEDARIDAAAWYMTGRLREARNDFRGAYAAYQKAVKLDPKSASIYRELVRLAFGLDEVEDGIRYGLKAVELDPSDALLLQRLGLHLAARSQFADAIRLLEQASKAPTMRKESAAYVTVMRSLALLYAATGEKEKAADSFEVVFDALQSPEKYKLDLRTRTQLAKEPATSYERIGQVFLDAKRPERAIEAFELAAKARQGKPGVLNFNLARVYVQTKQFDKALAELQKYFDAQLLSQGRAAYELLAEIFKKTDKSDQLIPKLEELAGKDSQNAALQFFLADQYVATKELDKAETLYRKVLEGAKDPQGYLGLAAVYRLKKEPQKLLEALSNVFAGATRESAERLDAEMKRIGADEQITKQLIDMGRKQIKAEPPELEYGSAILLAQLAATAKQDEAIVEFYRYALKRDQSRAALVYDQLGRQLMRMKKYGEAAELYREAADKPALERTRPQMLFVLSQALELEGKTDAAVKAVKEAKAIVPEAGLLHYQEGWIFYHAHRWEEAIKVFEQVIKKFEQKDKEITRRCQFSLSNIYVQMGQRAKGEGILEKVLAEDPDDPSVNNDLGYLYAEQGRNLERAEKMIRIAIKAEPENMAYLDSMGWVLYMRGKYAEALPYLVKAVELSEGGDATIFDHLADCYHKLGKQELAVKNWQQALKFAREESRPDEKLVKKIETKLSGKVEEKEAPKE
ncbi:MAG: hypothetical protein CMJ48_13045 [Planctomycetaceae bacterium]|nr:hypothetical protein [Planctomycetaceae bacterium]